MINVFRQQCLSLYRLPACMGWRTMSRAVVSARASCCALRRADATDRQQSTSQQVTVAGTSTSSQGMTHRVSRHPQSHKLLQHTSTRPNSQPTVVRAHRQSCSCTVPHSNDRKLQREQKQAHTVQSSVYGTTVKRRLFSVGSVMIVILQSSKKKKKMQQSTGQSIPLHSRQTSTVR